MTRPKTSQMRVGSSIHLRDERGRGSRIEWTGGGWLPHSARVGFPPLAYGPADPVQMSADRYPA